MGPASCSWLCKATDLILVEVFEKEIGRVADSVFCCVDLAWVLVDELGPV